MRRTIERGGDARQYRARRLVDLCSHGRLLVAGWLLLVSLAVPSAARAQTETVEYYGTDAIGSIRVVFDANGNELARADYLPFGDELSTSGDVPAEQFTGQIRDAEAGLDYFNARMFQPRIGRFTSVDPIYSGIFARRHGTAMLMPTIVLSRLLIHWGSTGNASVVRTPGPLR